MTGAESAQPSPEARRELFKRIRDGTSIDVPTCTFVDTQSRDFSRRPSFSISFNRQHDTVLEVNIPIYGYIYDVKSGKLVEVSEATTAGKAR
jgi:hypothetical protein